MFYRYDELEPNLMLPDRLARAQAIAEGLQSSEIIDMERRTVRLHLPNLEDSVEGDVSRTGFTVYFGGFDWVTYPTPPHVVSKFPEFMPLPQQPYPSEEVG